MNPIWTKKWYQPGKKSITGEDITNENIEVQSWKDLLRINKQSIAFYQEIVPYLYEYAVKEEYQWGSYSLLDIGTRTGVGANFIGEVFSENAWGYQMKLDVDTIDIDDEWNEYLKLMPYIRNSSNRDLFDIGDNSYNICLCLHVIEHLDDPVQFVNQMKRVATMFSVVSCPFNEINPIPGHRTITKEIVDACEPKFVTTCKSVTRWKEDLECVVFIV